MKGNNLKLKIAKRPTAITSKVEAKKPAKVVNLFAAKAKVGEKKTEFLTAEEREELVITHRIKARKLARSILRKWHSRLELQEIDSIVDLSLCETVRRYNPAYGASFITFLYYHMRGNLIRAISDAASQNTILVTDAELELTLNQDAGVERRLGANASEVAAALSGEYTPLPDEHLFKKELVNLSSDACAKLDSLEREVIYRIYLKEQQLIDVATQLGYSRCHISRVKKKALDALYGTMADSLDLDQKTRPTDTEDEVAETSVARRKIRRRRARAGHPGRLLQESAAA